MMVAISDFNKHYCMLRRYSTLCHASQNNRGCVWYGNCSGVEYIKLFMRLKPRYQCGNSSRARRNKEIRCMYFPSLHGILSVKK